MKVKQLKYFHIKKTVAIILIAAMQIPISKAQNIQYENLNKIYFYKTIDNFFSNIKDSIIAKDIVYDYGKIRYTDQKTNRKIKFSLLKDSAIFAFQYFSDSYCSPIYAINNSQKRYGVFMGGSKNLYFVLYTKGSISEARYDKDGYIIYLFGSIDYGYYLEFTKLNYKSKRNGDVEFFIQDKLDLYNKYINERNNASTFNYSKNYFFIQASFVKEYNQLNNQFRGKIRN